MTNTVAVRASSRVLSPVGGAVLGANGRPDLEVTAVADDLEVNVVVLGEQAEKVLIVTCDLLYIGDELRRAVLEALGSATSDSQLFFAASHTHRAPMVDSTKPGLGKPSPSVLESLTKDVATAVGEALTQRPSRCWIQVAQGTHSAGINRRKRRLFSVTKKGLHWRPTLMAPNPDGPNDNQVRRLRFVDAASEGVVAEVWSTALHPTGYPSRDIISADFPGHVRRAIRDEQGHSGPVLFFQGFSGNIRPVTPTTPWGVRRLLVGPGFAGFSEHEYRDWLESLALDVLNVTWQPLRGTRIVSLRRPIERRNLVDGSQGPSVGALHGLRIGDLGIVGVPSEVVVEYSSCLIPVTPLRDVWGVGCIDHVWGYSPTTSMLCEGGYEVELFCESFGVDSVNPAVESILGQGIESLISNLATS